MKKPKTALLLVSQMRKNCIADEMIIRKFKKEDLKEILEMTEQTWDGFSFDQVLEQKFGRKGKSWWERKADSLKEFIETHPEWVFVAEEEGKIVGYATYSLNREREIGEVLSNAVHPHCRGKGIGGTLHRKVLEELRREGMQAVSLVTSEKHIPAIKMYESAGFKEIWHSTYYAKKL